jgi:hypothetical protein
MNPLRFDSDNPPSIEHGELLIFDITVLGGCNSPVNYRLLEAPTGMTISNTGQIAWQASRVDPMFFVSASQVCDGITTEVSQSYVIDIEGRDGDLGNFIGFPTSCANGPTATVTSIEGSNNLQVNLTGTAPWSLLWNDGFLERNIQSSPHIRSINSGVTTSFFLLAVSDTNCSGVTSGQGTVTFEPTSIPSSNWITLFLMIGMMLLIVGFKGVKQRN